MLLAAALGLAFFGHVVSVTDGDTIAVMNAGRAETVRLEGVDCPERKQPFSSLRRASYPLSRSVPSGHPHFISLLATFAPISRATPIPACG